MAQPIMKHRLGSGAHAPAVTALEHRVLAHHEARAGSGATATPPAVASARQEPAHAPHRRGGSRAAKG